MKKFVLTRSHFLTTSQKGNSSQKNQRLKYAAAFAIGAALILLFIFYCTLSFLSRGENYWWFIDFVAEGNIYWGDDAYRYFLARSAWLNPQLYFFNFDLPFSAFADGVVTSFSHGSLLYARWIKAAFTVSAVALFCRTLLLLGLGRTIGFIGAALLALNPLFFFVSTSFFGEAWLAFLVVLALYFIAAKRSTAANVAVSLMPLARPEGIFFVGAFLFVSVVRRDWRRAVLVVVPGIVYLICILTIGPGLNAYSSWRFEMMRVYEGAEGWYGGPISRIFNVFALPVLLTAIAGWGLASVKVVRPFFFAAAVVILFVVLSAVFKTANFEPRYLAPVIPLVLVGWAAFINYILEAAGGLKRKGFGALVAAVFSLYVLQSEIFSLYVFAGVRDYFFEFGRLPDEVVEHPLSMRTYFKGMSKEEIDGYREYAGVATRMLRLNPAIETLVVSNFLAFYFLDPKEIPPNVRVVFSIFGRGRLDHIIGRDKAVGYFSTYPYFGYFQLKPPTKEEDLLLYLDFVPLANYPYHWVVKGHDIFLFEGELTNSYK